MRAVFLVMEVLSIEKPVPLQDSEILPVKSVPLTVKVLVTDWPTVVEKLNEVGLTLITGFAVAVPFKATVML